jgi:aspartate carbamoyltransferase regulatory subunit
MEINFCEQCDMKLDFYVDSETTDGPDKLYLGCKACGFKKEHTDKACIYNNDYKIDKSQIINQNPYLEHDITLPTIDGNQNISCPNDECISNKEKIPSEILYIKYDYENLKFSYICKHCKQNWTN